MGGCIYISTNLGISWSRYGNLPNFPVLEGRGVRETGLASKPTAKPSSKPIYSYPTKKPNAKPIYKYPSVKPNSIPAKKPIYSYSSMKQNSKQYKNAVYSYPSMKPNSKPSKKPVYSPKHHGQNIDSSANSIPTISAGLSVGGIVCIAVSVFVLIALFNYAYFTMRLKSNRVTLLGLSNKMSTDGNL